MFVLVIVCVLGRGIIWILVFYKLEMICVWRGGIFRHLYGGGMFLWGVRNLENCMIMK